MDILLHLSGLLLRLAIPPFLPKMLLNRVINSSSSFSSGMLMVLVSWLPFLVPARVFPGAEGANPEVGPPIRMTFSAFLWLKPKLAFSQEKRFHCWVWQSPFFHTGNFAFRASMRPTLGFSTALRMCGLPFWIGCKECLYTWIRIIMFVTQNIYNKICTCEIAQKVFPP